MKTTLDLPEDVADILRTESARLGGRKVAPLSRLVADAVREIYCAPRTAGEGIDLRPGRVVVRKHPSASQVDSADIRRALED